MWAMGRGGVALRGRPGAVDVNPAAIGRDGLIQGGIDVGADPLLGTSYNFAFEEPVERSPFVTVKQGRWAFATQVNLATFGELQRRDNNGQVVDTFKPRHYSVSVFAAYDLTDTWTLGGGVGYTSDNNFAVPSSDDITLSALTVDIGAYGEWEKQISTTAVLRPSVGVSLMHFGPNSTISSGFNGPEVALPTPTRLRLGGALRFSRGEKWYGRSPFSATTHLEVSKQMVSIEMSERTEASGPFAALINTWRSERRPPRSSGEEPITANVWQQVEKHLGAELSFYEVADLRIGRSQGAEEANLNAVTTFGIGVDLVYARLDYAGTLISRLDPFGDRSILRITVAVPLDGTYDNNWLGDLF